MPTTTEPDLPAALRQLRLTIDKMKARRSVLTEKREDILSDTELLLGPVGAEAEKLAGAIVQLQEKYDPLIDQFTSWNDDVKQFIEFFDTPPEDATEKEIAKLARFMVKFLKGIADLQTDTLKEMTESVELAKTAHTELRRFAAGD